MFKRLEISNFQSHRFSSFEFVSGLNVITGASDKGKSSVVRALIWLAKNQPLGFGFRSNFAGKDEDTRVALELDEEQFVVRERGDGNRYLVSGYDDPFEAFKSDPPPEVGHILRLGDFNIQGQHDNYFLLQATSGEVARVLNNLVGLDVIDTAMRNVNSIVMKSKDGVENATETIERLESELSEYDYLPVLEKELDRLEGYLREREAKRWERRTLDDLVRKIDVLNGEISGWEDWLEIEGDAKGLIEEAEEIRDILAKRNAIADLAGKIEVVEERINHWKERSDDYDRTLALIEECREAFHVREERNEVLKAVDRLGLLEGLIEEAQGKIRDLEVERDEIGVLCPKCGYKFKSEELG